MERLTIKTPNNEEPYDFACGINEFMYGNGAEEIINKLGQLEDTEQELGIDLVTFICAIKKWLKYIRIGVDFYRGYCCGIVALALEDKSLCIIYETQNREECKQLEIIRKALAREELE